MNYNYEFYVVLSTKHNVFDPLFPCLLFASEVTTTVSLVLGARP